MLFSQTKRRSAMSRIEKLFVVFFAVILSHATGYNFDVKNSKTFGNKIAENSSNSYFGFSVALYAPVNLADASILVGAPRANNSASAGVIEPGTVYRCKINGNSCVEWNLDPTSNGKVNESFHQIKDNAWIGSTIGIENKTDPRVVVCGPRWKTRRTSNTNESAWFMNGICYWSYARNDEIFQKPAENRMTPLLDGKLQILNKNYNYAMGQTGFSLHMYSNDLMLGNPGVYNWRGVPSVSTFLNHGIIHQPRILIENVTLINNDDYLGYSVTSGYYFEKKERLYASGAPRGANMLGRVLIFRYDIERNKKFTKLVVKKYLDGEQYGEYFGASLTSCDINNDGRDEIIVGAPHWSSHVDEGRVYAYIANSENELKPQYLEGPNRYGQFGTVVTCLGDVDHDGYGDIAVSAPYEYKHGAVYIYNGNSEGLSQSRRQRIIYKPSGIRGFGVAISEPRDVDGDGYADIAVGAYLSGVVVLLRSRPVITMKVTVEHGNVTKLNKNSKFFDAKVCSTYYGFRVPEKLNVTEIFEVDALRGRAYLNDSVNINDNYNNSVTLDHEKLKCKTWYIYLLEDLENSIDPVEFKVTLVFNHSKQMDNRPVVNKALSKTIDTLLVPFNITCESGKECLSNLTLSITSDLGDGNRYTLGSKRTFEITILAKNSGDRAYDAKAYIYVPTQVSLSRLPSECAENSRSNRILEITCELGNPLEDEKILILELDMSKVRSDTKKINITANPTTQSLDVNLNKNTRNLTIHIDIDVDIAIVGKSQDALYSYFNEKENKVIEVVRFQHIYEIQKFGNSHIDESVVTVDVPTNWKNEGHDIEIAQIHQINGLMKERNLKCVNWSLSSDMATALRRKKIITPIERTNDSNNENHTFDRTEKIRNLSVPPHNGEIYFNCTNNKTVKCTRISCKLGKFADTQTIAKLTIILDLQLRNFPHEIMKTRDIVFFVSNGSVSIEKPTGIIQSGNMPDSVLAYTKFVDVPIKSHLSTWIIVVSVLAGLLLLGLLSLVLAKYGFFRRQNKEALEELKAMSDKKPGPVPETSSSEAYEL